MTQREFFTKTIEVLENAEMFDLVEFAKDRIKQLDKKNSSRKNKLTKTQIENIDLKNKIMAFFNDEPNTHLSASEIGEKFEISTSKASALLLQLTNEDYLSRSLVAVKGKGKRWFYTLKVEE